MAYRPVHRLESMLKHWEDFCLMQQTAIKQHLAYGLRPPFPLIGAYKNWAGLRQDIMRRELFDGLKYGLPHDIVKELQLFGCIPFFAWSWSHWSRRTFCLSRELQALLSATTTRGITYADLALPFESFVLELPRPLVDQKNRQYDAILVASGSPDKPLNTDREMILVPLCGEPVLPTLADKERDHLKEIVAQERWEKVAKFHGMLARKLEFSRPVGGLIVDRQDHGQISVSVPIDEAFTECACGRKHECRSVMHDQMVRLVVGFCLYLKTLPSGSPHPSSWSPLGKSARFYVSAVTNGANICEVGHEIKLDAEQLDILEGHYVRDENDDCRLKTEIKAHFRIGYWRRWPGTGHDPNAPKIIHIHPTFVRRDKLAEGFVPEAVRVKMA